MIRWGVMKCRDDVSLPRSDANSLMWIGLPLDTEDSIAAVDAAIDFNRWGGRNAW